jgi:hypothetical protein
VVVQSDPEDERVVGNGLTHVTRRDRHDPATRTVEHRAHLDTTRAAALEVLEEVGAGEPRVDQVFHQHDVAPTQLQLHVLHDAHTTRVRRVPGDGEEVHLHVDRGHRAHEIGEEHERALEHADHHHTVGMVDGDGRSETLHHGRELGAIENDA